MEPSLAQIEYRSPDFSIFPGPPRQTSRMALAGLYCAGAWVVYTIAIFVIEANFKVPKGVDDIIGWTAVAIPFIGLLLSIGAIARIAASYKTCRGFRCAIFAMFANGAIAALMLFLLEVGRAVSNIHG